MWGDGCFAPDSCVKYTMEQLSPNSPWYAYVSIDPDRLGGEPVFRSTRVPVKTLFDYLGGGYSLEVFLDHFEGVTREQAEGVLNLLSQMLPQELRAA